MAAKDGNLTALKELTLHFKQKSGVTEEDLAQSEEYNLQLLQKLQNGSKAANIFIYQNRVGELRGTKKDRAQLQRLGRSWQEAYRQTEENPHKEYQPAKEPLGSRQYKDGMVRMRSAAEKRNVAARFELAVRVLNGPRPFSEEVKAVTDLQDLDREGSLPANFRVGMLYQSNTDVVPNNLYISRTFFRKILADSELKEKADRRLNNHFDLIEGLQMLSNVPAWNERLIVCKYNALQLHAWCP